MARVVSVSGKGGMVTRVERWSPTIEQRARANQRWEEPVSEAKPYGIPKQLVWDAYRWVKANGGAAGVDGESLTMFEQDLKGNLYKIWNRMSSGTYFPPQVEPVFHPDSYGYRPGRSAHDALAMTRQRCWAADWVIDLNIKGFF